MVVDVSAVFTQVQGNSVGTGFERDAGSFHGVGESAASGVPQGGDVVDVYA
jgi:hypothetical protein